MGDRLVVNCIYSLRHMEKRQPPQIARNSSISDRLFRDSKKRAEKLESQRHEFLLAEKRKIEIDRAKGLQLTAEVNRQISRDVNSLYADHFKRKEKREVDRAKALAAEDDRIQREISRVFPTRRGNVTPQNMSRASFGGKENSMMQEQSVVSRLLAAKDQREKKLAEMKKQLEMEEKWKIEATKFVRVSRPKEDRAKADMFSQVLSHRRSQSCGPTNHSTFR